MADMDCSRNLSAYTPPISDVKPHRTKTTGREIILLRGGFEEVYCRIWNQ
jgi:hypothetical protein